MQQTGGLMRLPAWLAALLLLCLSTPLNAQVAPWGLGGSYNFSTVKKRPDGKPVCEERWTFNADGRAVVLSGAEIVQFRYRVERTQHHTWLVEEGLRTNGLADCVGHVQTGPEPIQRRIFIFPLAIGDFLVCSGPQQGPGGREVISTSNCYARASRDRTPAAY